MVAHAPFGDEVTRPTVVKVNRKTDKDGNTTSKTVEYPNDPHVQLQGPTAGPRPQTQHSGYAQGGTTNPPVGDDGKPKWYSPDGDEESTPEKMFARDAEVNPVPYETGPRHTDTLGTSDDPVYTDGTGKDGKS